MRWTGRLYHIVVIGLITCEAPAHDLFGGSIGASTDYVYRGVSLTSSKAALQGEVHIQSRGEFHDNFSSRWTAGVWVSTISPVPSAGTTFELAPGIGRNWTLGADWDAAVQLTHYFYPHDHRPLDYDYDEITASVGYRSRARLTIAWSPDTSRFADGYTAIHRTALSYELTALQPVTNHWSAIAGVGYYDLSSLFGVGYWYYNVGLTCTISKATLSTSFISTDHQARRLFGYQTSADRWAGSLLWRF